LGNDKLYGQWGNDKLYGGSGNDTLHGGLGHDTYIIADIEGHNRIQNFDKNEDVLGIHGNNPSYRIEYTGQFGNYHTDTLIYFGHNLAATIEGASITNSQIAVEHFLDSQAIEFDQYIASHTDLIQSFGNRQHSYQQTLNFGQYHYNHSGFNENRALDRFNEAQYLASNDDLINVFGNRQHNYEKSLDLATEHYIMFGASEHRSLNTFDAASYLGNNHDLQAFFKGDLISATKHYIEFGASEGRVF